MTFRFEVPSNDHRGVPPLWMELPRIIPAVLGFLAVCLALWLWGDGSTGGEPVNRFWNRRTQRYNLNLPAPGEFISIAAVATSVVIVSLGVASFWLLAWLVVNAAFLLASLKERRANESKRRKYNQFLTQHPPHSPPYK